jgi:small-conductance mechanosensitive channel
VWLCALYAFAQWDIMGELRRRLKKAFDEEGIEIPFPHVTLVTRGAKATDVGEGEIRGG